MSLEKEEIEDMMKGMDQLQEVSIEVEKIVKDNIELLDSVLEGSKD